MFDGGKKLTVAKGKKVTAFDMKKDPPAQADFAAAVLGPTGNLRAPAIKTGKTWLIGFNEDAYAERLA